MYFRHAFTFSSGAAAFTAISEPCCVLRDIFGPINRTSLTLNPTISGFDHPLYPVHAVPVRIGFPSE